MANRAGISSQALLAVAAGEPHLGELECDRALARVCLLAETHVPYGFGFVVFHSFLLDLPMVGLDVFADALRISLRLLLFLQRVGVLVWRQRHAALEPRADRAGVGADCQAEGDFREHGVLINRLVKRHLLVKNIHA